MEVYLNKITGIDTAIKSMFISKRHLTRELELEIERVCDAVLNSDGGYFITEDENGNTIKCCRKIYSEAQAYNKVIDKEDVEKFRGWMKSLTKIGSKHITLLRFIELHCSVYGLHRAGQDDWDAHVKRFENKIVRESTRLAEFTGVEKSDYYKDKILTMDEVISALNKDMPSEVEIDGETYVRATNGYIKKGLEDNKDVKRGLYMESIPSNFVYNCNITEMAHVYKMRNMNSTANPEVQECCEKTIDGFTKAGLDEWFNRELMMVIPN